MSTREQVVELRAGDVVRYEPKSRWCHDGYAIATEWGGRLVLMDTYWYSQGGDSVVAPASYELLFNLGDYETKPQHEWEKYAPDDRHYLGKQHGCHPTYYVRKDAEPDHAQQVANAQERVAEAEGKVQSAQSMLEWRRRDLAQLETGQVVQ